jgi:HD-like signal output (HDOD) protein
MRLGTGTVLSLTVGAAVQARMQRAVPEYGLHEGQLWRHSMAAALAAQAVKEYSRYNVPPESFAAALLHDIGKLVMSRFLSPNVLEMLRRANREGGLSTMQAERELLGVHHGELGGLVAQHWKLPESIVHGVSYHHAPEEIDEPVAYVVYLANQAARRLGTDGMGEGETVHPEEHAAARAQIGLSTEDFDRLCAAVEKRMKTVESH